MVRVQHSHQQHFNFMHSIDWAYILFKMWIFVSCHCNVLEVLFVPFYALTQTETETEYPCIFSHSSNITDYAY